jgi:opacity protein-like surface antigen
MRRSLCLVGVFFLVSFSLAAQERSTTDVFVGYTYIRAEPSTSAARDFNLNGGSASVAFNPRAWRGWLGITGDIGGYHVGNVGAVNVGSNLFTYMAGPQVYTRNFGRVTPFAHILFGGAHSTGSALGLSGSRNSFAMAPGGGLDFRLTKHMSLRAGPVEYLFTNFKEITGGGQPGPTRMDRQVQNNLRVSTGVRWRF